jgi:hypothetical protein
MWTTSLDLTDAYFHILISPKFCKFLRFVWEYRVYIYAFKMMPFGLSTAPLVFTRIFQTVVANLPSQSIFIHSYLDDFFYLWLEEKCLVADLLRYAESFPEPFFIGPVSEWD